MKAKLTMWTTIVLALCAAAYWFMSWNLNRSFRRADWNGLQALIEAPIGEIVTARLVAQPGSGAVPYYHEHPEALQRDERYLQTWHSAKLIANSARGREQAIGSWTASTNITWILPANRMDAWGHFFCVRSNPEGVAVVSPGPQAIASLDCETLRISEEDFAKMVPGRLNVESTGVLVLILRSERESGHF